MYFEKLFPSEIPRKLDVPNQYEGPAGCQRFAQYVDGVVADPPSV